MTVFSHSLDNLQRHPRQNAQTHQGSDLEHITAV
jgi:hypothetical protein